MKITTVSPRLAQISRNSLVLGVAPADLKSLRAKSGKGSAGTISLATLNAAEKGGVAKEISSLSFTAKTGTQVTIHTAIVGRVVLVGLGAPGKEPCATGERWRSFGATVLAAATRNRISNPVVAVGEQLATEPVQLAAFVEGITLGGYQFLKYKKSKAEPGFVVKGVGLVSTRQLPAAVVRAAQRDAEATMMARDLINLPPNDCVPSTLVAKARKIARAGGYKLEVFDRKKLQKLKAGSLLAVAQGSEEPPYLIRMIKPAKRKNARKIAIVGKGVTFDSGGLSIKPAQSMEDMKSDMAGAAAVLAAMQALSGEKLDVELHCYVPTVENMINGRATRPGDVVRAMNGTSIEILNTDAEGRLILADAVCLAERDGCEVIVDLATLTGACMVALGLEYAGLFSTDDQLARRITEAAEGAGEKLWRLPLPPEYRRLMDSPIADIKNSGPRFGGAITAAIFIKEFITNPKTKWAHLDIAGPSYTESERGYIKKGGVGFGVRTLTRWLRAL